ncbi:hypothetical protein [Helicobacter felis]|uniref:Uncharacterized protein n=1 Tax=Helicobacter felis (strain ATCC 49179 / CCUG 28539 / NCTC 12436 / CS1) TaxID=936155 RepID=E7ABJ8_HELFC|nr:hypothetical protein [Helicobacter felis]CBY82877.1 unnamed protein product [Helicobacter felis ATCC 49179]
MGFIKSLAIMLFFLTCANAYVLESLGSEVHLGFYHVPPNSLVWKKRRERKGYSYKKRLGAFLRGKPVPSLESVAVYEARSMHLGQYEDFTNKFQKHVKIHLPQMGNHVKASSMGACHVNLHWKF